MVLLRAASSMKPIIYSLLLLTKLWKGKPEFKKVDADSLLNKALDWLKSFQYFSGSLYNYSQLTLNYL